MRGDAVLSLQCDDADGATRPPVGRDHRRPPRRSRDPPPRRDSLTDPIPGLDVTIVVDQHASCFGHSDGQATATATGGVEPYSYLWNDPAAQTSATASGLIAGDYTITVTDAAGSTATASVTIEEPGQLSATVIHTEVSCIGALDGEISFTNITGGSGNYEYSIDGGTNWSSDATFEGLAAGTYDIWLGDANKAGCTMPLGLFIVTSPPAILASYDTIPATCGSAPLPMPWAGPPAGTTGWIT